jgi:hypothetical protein
MDVLKVMLPAVYLIASLLILDGLFSLLKKKTSFWLTRQIIASYIRYFKQVSYLRQIVLEDKQVHKPHRITKPVDASILKAVEHRSKPSPEPVVEILQRAARSGQPMILYGEPGAGKTTALHAVVLQTAQHAFWVRAAAGFIFLLIALILIFTASWAAFLWLISFVLFETLFFRETIPVYLEASQAANASGISQWCDDRLNSQLGGQPSYHVRPWFTLFVDAVEELHTHQIDTLFSDLRMSISRYTIVNVIAAVRTDIDLSDAFCSAAEYEMLGLDDTAIRQLAEIIVNDDAQPDRAQYFLQQLDDKGLIGDDGLGRNPFWLKLMLDTGYFSRSKGRLLHTYCEWKIGGEILSGSRETVSVDMVLTALATLSLSMHQNGLSGFRGEEQVRQGYEVVRANLEYTLLSVEDCFEISANAGLIHYEAGKTLRFTHALFQDYFTAHGIIQFSVDWELVRQKAENLDWWSSLFLLGGLAEVHYGIETVQVLTDTLINEGGTIEHYLAALGILYDLEEIPMQPIQNVCIGFSNLILGGYGQSVQPAIEQLMLVAGYEIATVFEEMYHSPDPQIQILAAILLCTAGIPACDDFLLNKPVEVTLPVLRVLGIQAVEFLLYRLESDDDVVGYRATELLVGIGKPALESIGNALHHKNARVRRYVTRAITRIGGEDAFQLLFHALADEDYDVWKQAADGLSKLGGDTLMLLRRCAEDPTTPSHLKERIELIFSGKISTPIKAEKIDVASDFDPDTSKIAGPSRAMAEPSAFHLLLKPGVRYGIYRRREGRALRHRSYQIRASGTGMAPAPTWSEGEGAHVHVQNETAHLEQLGLPPDFEDLLKRIGHEDVFVRSAAIEDVRKFGCTLVPYLLKALDTDDRLLLEGLLDALAEVANMNSVSAMRRFRDKAFDPIIRKKAERAIERMRMRTL